ncbi:multidrug effflux MFS transporter [Microbacterium sp. B2969]|uniref:Multidrug effflux MFS transporter n=1 Tax=Microbacterium alkaliflavum TaxID=3248839 RepID=A0ABW7QDA4_9MICO
MTIALLAALSPLATAMYLPALPAMAVDLTADARTLQLTVTAFMVGLAVGQLIIGPLSDRTGRRSLLIAGAGACVVASAACALAPSIQILIFARLLQGLSGAAGIVLGRAIIADTVRGNAAARAFSLLMSIGAIAPVIAPLIGSAIAEASGWRGVFAALLVCAIAMLLGSVVFLPETLHVSRRRAARLRTTVREAVRVILHRRFAGYAVVLVFSYASLIAYVSASPFVLQIGYGLAPGAYALAFAANAAGLTLASFANARLVRRFSPRRLLAVGLTGELGVASGILVAAITATLNLGILLVLLWAAVACLGLVMGNATSLAMDQVSRSAGSGSALLGAAQFALAAIVAPLASVGVSGSPLAMAGIMTVCAGIAAITFVMTTCATRWSKRSPATRAREEAREPLSED